METPRVPETAATIEGSRHAEAYDRMQAALRDKGWLETRDITAAGIDRGTVLEIGPGPGYLGLDWLTETPDTRLTGIDSSVEMLKIAERNACKLGLSGRAEYVCGSADAMPFGDGAFDGVFASRSLHEWGDPAVTFAEIWRVLKAGGRLFVSDLRRDLTPAARGFLLDNMTSEVVRDGLVASIGAAYTAAEVEVLLAGTPFGSCDIVETAVGMRVLGARAG